MFLIRRHLRIQDLHRLRIQLRRQLHILVPLLARILVPAPAHILVPVLVRILVPVLVRILVPAPVRILARIPALVPIPQDGMNIQGGTMDGITMATGIQAGGMKVIDVDDGWWQCTAFNAAMETFSRVGPDEDQAAYGALYACGGANYQQFGCYIPPGYCQQR